MNSKSSADEITRRNVSKIARMERSAEQNRTTGERIADTFAHSIGSWTFIIAQTAILIIWVVLNVVGWIRSWDPYPFILLNLGLSFQAAYSSPIIMMSQNRQGRLNDRRNQLDLQINLLAEQENTAMLILLKKICEKLEISIQDDPDLLALQEATKPENLVKQIEKALK